MCFIRWMQDFKEHWVLVRTPEQFDIMYECCKDLAAQAKAPIVSKEAVPGFKEFKDTYVMPQLTMLVDKMHLTLSATSQDLYGLSPFLNDPAYWSFTFMDGTFQTQVQSKQEMKRIQNDLMELTELWGWQLNL